jgi:hypothetical protein
MPLDVEHDGHPPKGGRVRATTSTENVADTTEKFTIQIEATTSIKNVPDEFTTDWRLIVNGESLQTFEAGDGKTIEETIQMTPTEAAGSVARLERGDEYGGSVWDIDRPVTDWSEAAASFVPLVEVDESAVEARESEKTEEET